MSGLCISCDLRFLHKVATVLTPKQVASLHLEKHGQHFSSIPRHTTAPKHAHLRMCCLLPTTRCAGARTSNAASGKPVSKCRRWMAASVMDRLQVHPYSSVPSARRRPFSVPHTSWYRPALI